MNTEDGDLLPAVAATPFPRHPIPFFAVVKGLLTMTGGIGGRWRAVKNAFTKPWRLKYRYWQRADRQGDSN